MINHDNFPVNAEIDENPTAAASRATTTPPAVSDGTGNGAGAPPEGSRLDAREIKARLCDVPAVVEALGIDAHAEPQKDGLKILCPWHEERHPSCSVRTVDEVIVVHCFACGAKGDVFSLIAKVHGLDVKADFRRVLELAKELADAVGTDAAPAAMVDSAPTIHGPASALLRACPVDQSEEVVTYLRGRALLDAAIADGWGALPHDAATFASVRATVGDTAAAGLGLVDAKGKPKFAGHPLVIPWRGPDGQIDTIQRRTLTEDGPRKYVMPARLGAHSPFGVDKIGNAGRDLAIVEGAADVLALRTLCAAHGIERDVIGLPGVGAWKLAWDRFVRSRVVIVAVDNDDAGNDAVAKIAKLVMAAGAKAVHRRVPSAGKDWGECLVALSKDVGSVTPVVASDAHSSTLVLGPFERDVPLFTPKLSVEQATTANDVDLFAFACDLLPNLELFHSDDATSYATFDEKGRAVTVRVLSTRFKRKLRTVLYKARKQAIGDRPMSALLDQFDAHASIEGPKLPVHRRVAEVDGAIVLDLSDRTGRVVRMTPAGWDVCTMPEVRFVEDERDNALPEPVRGGTIAELRDFVNVKSEDAFCLLVAWLLALFMPKGPYPVLRIEGEHGSAKSTATKIVKKLLDPTRPLVRRLTGKVEDLMIAALHSRVVALDNISGLSADVSDTLCCIATGGGFATRRLHTNTEEVFIEVCRPVVINGIDSTATRGDLADRAVLLELAAIPDDQRRDEQSLWAAFEMAQPRILGALCDAVCVALRRAPDVRLDEVPRMADFAKWVTAAEPAIGLDDGEFVEIYARNRAEAIGATAEGDVVAVEFVAFVQTLLGTPISITATELLARLNTQNPERRFDRGWPKTPQQLSNRLRRAKDALTKRGIEIDFAREGNASVRKILVRGTPLDAPIPTDPNNVVPIHGAFAAVLEGLRSRGAKTLVDGAPQPARAAAGSFVRPADDADAADDADIKNEASNQGVRK